ncbi:MAG: hypothetical protein M1839_004191 [Geoglossum umbratile]|nr:MAG: hypothetical protein M1839_004191 [Geoglossum umbratile]
MFALVSSNDLELVLLGPIIKVRLGPVEALATSDVPIVAPQPFATAELLNVNVLLRDLQYSPLLRSSVFFGPPPAISTRPLQGTVLDANS